MNINKIKSFTDLNAWREGHKLVVAVYQKTKLFPREELYGLVNQIRRCAVSITSNLAEGFSRQTQKEKKQFYYTALGSVMELQNQLLLSRDLGYLSEGDFALLAGESVKVSKLITGLIKSAKSIQDTKYKIQNTNPQSGQVVLVVVLVMVVALTIGLSLVARTTTDIKISRQQEESARAFSAAEAGIEEALRTGAAVGAPMTLESGASYSTTVAEFGGSQFTFPEEISPGEAVTLWLNGHDADGNLLETSPYTGSAFTVCWENGAIEVSIYYKQSGEYKVTRSAYDPDAVSHSNNFALPDGGGCLNLAHKKTINLPGGTPLFANLKPYYSATKIGVVASGTNNFPSQGKEIESTGTLGTITRKVKVFRSWPGPPAVFDYVLFY